MAFCTYDAVLEYEADTAFRIYDAVIAFCTYEAVYANDAVIVETFIEDITPAALFLSCIVPAAFCPMVAPNAKEYDEVAPYEELTAFRT